MIGYLLAAAAGAGVALLYAPMTGKAARARLKDKWTHYSTEACELADKKSRHLSNKLKGLKHEAGKLEERMREQVKEVSSQLNAEEEPPRNAQFG